MAQVVWVLEHRYWQPCHCRTSKSYLMDATVLFVASSLQLAQEHMKEPQGRLETKGWYCIYPDVLDGSMFDEQFSSAINRICEDGATRLAINFYDLAGQRIEAQPEPPYSFG